MKARSKRKYKATRREQSSLETKQRIQKAALKLFSKRGIDAVTIDEIAARAEVSAPTVYALFKSKAGILHALMSNALLGTSYDAVVARLKETTDPVRMLEITASIARTIYDSEASTLGLLRGVSAFSKDLAKIEQDFERLRLDLQRPRIDALFASKRNKRGLDRESARRILWMYTSRDVYRMLAIESRWGSDKYQHWLAETLVATLTEPPAAPGRPSA